ncbi:hypothetical protein [Thiocystis violascens]|uniref:Uncharacterized protein n=1 Tax=Thiocystis violascens (strain ATCC 17096 / DSM 198 / 6111) TaxID=765911 RepID=I3Y8S1_THIV6|nr:hypothetical protein [Thiocystis violascens]AFL73389.1 hypothetical protein Thivi_1381 [Thiocystis violascens DSM 198]
MSDSDNSPRQDSGVLFLIESLGSLRELLAAAVGGLNASATQKAVDALRGCRQK